MHLGRRGHRVHGIDLDEKLVASLNECSGSLDAIATLGDARRFSLGSDFAFVLAPMQLIQLLADSDERVSCLRCVAAHLRPDGLAAFAIVESMPEPVDSASPLPDTREVDGWVYSSLPLDATAESGAIRVRRLRQTVSPQGELEEDLNEISLRTLDGATLEDEARRAGLRPAGRRTIPPTDDHVGSTVVLLERET